MIKYYYYAIHFIILFESKFRKLLTGFFYILPLPLINGLRKISIFII